MDRLWLEGSTVDAFSHRLHQTETGAVRALHRCANAGEESGIEGRSFVRDDAAGDGGHGLFMAAPRLSRKFDCILVAESFESALAAWEAIPDTSRR